MNDQEFKDLKEEAINLNPYFALDEMNKYRSKIIVGKMMASIFLGILFYLFIVKLTIEYGVDTGIFLGMMLCIFLISFIFVLMHLDSKDNIKKLKEVIDGGR